MQTVDLKTAQELSKVLPKGFESGFYWHDKSKRKHAKKIVPEWVVSHDQPQRDEQGKICCACCIPAPTLCELLEILPDVHAVKPYITERGEKVNRELRFQWVMTGGDIEYVHFPGYSKLGFGSYQGFDSFGAHDQNSATAAAKLYIWLHNNGCVPTTDKEK